MKKIFHLLALFLFAEPVSAQGPGRTIRFDLFTCFLPAGYQQGSQPDFIFANKQDSRSYCQLFLYPHSAGLGNADSNFKAQWDGFARNPEQQIGDPDQIKSTQSRGWNLKTGQAKGRYGNTSFQLIVQSYTGPGLTFYAAAVYTDNRYLDDIKRFFGSIVLDPAKFQKQPATPVPATGAQTRFDDGWVSRPAQDFVEVTRPGTEVRLYYVNDGLENARTQYQESTLYYWNQWVEPEFTVTASPVKFEGVTYPVIYHQQAPATRKKDGQRVYVALKVIYQGGARVVMSITPDAASYRQLFPHPNDMDRMLGYNRFPVQAAGLVGNWKQAGGGGVEYYNAYTGQYAGMSALSTTDEFRFFTDGRYESVHNSANTNNGSTQFAALRYQGRYSTDHWSMLATNRVGGKTKKFLCHQEAVKGGFILVLTDSDYTPLVYHLYKTNQ